MHRHDASSMTVRSFVRSFVRGILIEPRPIVLLEIFAASSGRRSSQRTICNLSTTIVRWSATVLFPSLRYPLAFHSPFFSTRPNENKGRILKRGGRGGVLTIRRTRRFVNRVYRVPRNIMTQDETYATTCSTHDFLRNHFYKQ